MSQTISRQDFINENPELAHLQALRGSGQFSQQQTRLRDLKPQEARFNLAPLYQQEEKVIEKLEAFDARFIENLRKLDKGDAAGKAAAANGQAAISRELQQQKSTARIEKLKDIQASIELARTRLAGLKPGATSMTQLRSLIQSGQSQLTAVYAGQLSLVEGTEIVRPYLVQLAEKLDCVQPAKYQAFGALRKADLLLNQNLQSPNPVPVMEKACLLALSQCIDQVLEAFIALATGESPEPVQSTAQSEEPVSVDLQLRQHQPSLQLLMRACRSHEDMLRQLQAFHGNLGQPQELYSLGLLKSSLQQLRDRSLRELQGFVDVTSLHLPALSPLQPLVKNQHQRLKLACTPDFLSLRNPQPDYVQPPEMPSLPGAFQALVAEYTQLTDKVVVAFEALTTQCLEAEKNIQVEGQLADLDALFST